MSSSRGPAAAVAEDVVVVVGVEAADVQVQLIVRPSEDPFFFDPLL